MYIDSEDNRFRNKEPIKLICDLCQQTFFILYKSAIRQIKKYNEHRCHACNNVNKPQNFSDFWTEDKKLKISQSLLKSEAYKNSRIHIDIKSENNPMFGKKHTEQTIKKMSLARTGKLGENATAWKGGSRSIVKTVKGILHTRYNWYKRVYQRDGFKCVKCFSKGKLDAHHIKPIVVIIKELQSQSDKCGSELIEWLVTQPQILDSDLKNGMTLCRECHKKEHNNWGSKLNP